MATTSESITYKNQTKVFLENEFPWISCSAIDVILNHENFDFPLALRRLLTIHSFFPHGDGRVFPFIPPGTKVFLKRKRPVKHLRVENQRLRDQINVLFEVEANENNPPSKDEDDPNSEERGKLKEEEDEVLMECGCCFGEYRPEQVKECSAGEGHNVCTECINRYVSEQLDGNNRTDFQCIVNDECSCNYTTKLLDQVLSPGLKTRTDDRIYREQVRKVALEGLNVWECPQCAYIGFADEGYPTIECPECEVFYCSRCNDVEHDKRTCDEVRQEKDRLKNPVIVAQEAMSLAVKRRCPQCYQEFQKGDGCNKMTCYACRTLSCYLCGKQIEDYTHFCNHLKPCGCGKTCELWTNTDELEMLDRAKRKEAGRKVLKDSGMREDEIMRALASPPQQKYKALREEPEVIEID